MTDPRITAVAAKLQACFGPFAESQAEWVATMLLDAADAADPSRALLAAAEVERDRLRAKQEPWPPHWRGPAS